MSFEHRISSIPQKNGVDHYHKKYAPPTILHKYNYAQLYQQVTNLGFTQKRRRKQNINDNKLFKQCQHPTKLWFSYAHARIILPHTSCGSNPYRAA